MIESQHQTCPPEPSHHRVEVSDDGFLVDAELVGELLHLPPARVPVLMREGEITSACERGVADHDGQYRLTFYYGTRRARLATDLTGRILRRSVVDFGNQPKRTPPERKVG